MREDLRVAFEVLGTETVHCHSLSGYPSGGELARILRMFSPQVVLLSFEKPDIAALVMRFLESEADGLPVVAVHRAGGADMLLGAMRAGVREFLEPPFEAVRLDEILRFLRTLLRRAPLAYSATDHIYSFLPSKPGVGTSTVALNVSAALAHEPGMRVLLSDLDLTCGLIRFLLKLPQDLSIVDALRRATDMDVSLWPQLVSHHNGIDILHSGSINPQAYLEPAQVQGLIDFARSAYNALFFDLSGNLERHSIQVMQESKRVFLVCNPEPGSLFLAGEKLSFLRTIGIAGRVSVIVNRANQALALSSAHIQQFLRVPIAAEFVNDTDGVNASVAEASSVVNSHKGQHSKLARQYRVLARQLLESARSQPLESSALPEVNHRVSAVA